MSFVSESINNSYKIGRPLNKNRGCMRIEVTPDGTYVVDVPVPDCWDMGVQQLREGRGKLDMAAQQLQEGCRDPVVVQEATERIAIATVPPAVALLSCQHAGRRAGTGIDRSLCVQSVSCSSRLHTRQVISEYLMIYTHTCCNAIVCCVKFCFMCAFKCFR